MINLSVPILLLFLFFHIKTGYIQKVNVRFPRVCCYRHQTVGEKSFTHTRVFLEDRSSCSTGLYTSISYEMKCPLSNLEGFPEWICFFM